MSVSTGAEGLLAREEPYVPLVNTVPETALRLRISRSSVYGLFDSGQLKSIRVGGRRLVPESPLVEFIQQRIDEAG